ncbi:hypothetical protein SAMN04487910_2158 [Aquimarina amphilecti]|uniref:Uncharacterized protein n=1 Tax=Aquimarina amphilecti TaxID=1038014 RepID=A0A1H7NNM4_AQUAM|nr:hypothetical protein [Aquimarina amphilecti]SEL25132.1 hypothetical protein SAMN04487910_2158 [Aquimarina amphilecti]
MKTIQVCIGLFMLAVVPFGCSDDDIVDDIVVPDAEETGTFLEQDLHVLYLSRQDDLIAEEIASVEEELVNDPDNQDLQGQLEELQERREANTEQINFLNGQIEEIVGDLAVRPRVPRLPPVPPPPLPCTCFTDVEFSRLEQILLAGNAEGFAVTVFTENQEVIAEFGNLTDFEDTGLQVISLNEAIDFQGNVVIQISKFFEPIGDITTYSIEGNINL